MDLSFKQMLHILGEGTQEEVTALQKQVTDIDVMIQQRTKPLVDRKTRLQVMLAQKQKLLDTEQKAQPAQNTPMAQQGTTTTTPGATATQTPGVGGPKTG